MLFNSYNFIFVFLPITLVGYYALAKRRLQLAFLFLASTIFYAYWSPKYVFLLLFTVLLDFYIAKNIFKARSKKKKTILLATSMTANLSILSFFKYYNLFADTFNHFTSSSLALHSLSLVLPIGISFYTFQSMSYVIDVYRGTSDAHSSLLSFASYVTLFPHQISGPLVRHNLIVPQLEVALATRFKFDNFWKGCCFFILGLSKKLLIADLLSVIVAPLVSGMESASNLEAFLALSGYALQLYFDFSGYSDMAVGLGLMMNISFPQNFNSPYKSQSITEFWQRWHISLSSWLRDYLYISLGGNRKGPLKTYRNLFLTMAIGGLWHGGNWTFAAWGAYNGVLLCLERFTKNALWLWLPKAMRIAVTFFLTCLGWVFFRSPSFHTARVWFTKLFFLNPSKSFDLLSLPERFQDRFFFALGTGLIIAFFLPNTWQLKFVPQKTGAVTLGILFALCLMFMGDESPFLYFQF